MAKTYQVSNAQQLQQALATARNGDTVQFTAGGTYALMATTALPAGLVTFDTQAYAVKIDNAALTDAATGVSALAKIGSGTLNLDYANTYSGGTTISAGTVEASTGETLAAGVETASSVGTGPVNFDGGTLQLDGITLANAATLDANGGIIGLNGFSTLTGNITTAAGTAAPGGLTVAAVPGAGGILYLTGTDTIAGGLTIVGDEVSLGDGQNAGGTFTGNVTLGANGHFDFDGVAGTTRTYAGTISGGSSTDNDGVRQQGGTTILTGVNTYAGQTTISGGTLQAGAPGALSSASAVMFTTTAAGTTLDLDGTSQTVAGLSSTTAATTSDGVFMPAGTVTNSGTTAATLRVTGGAGGYVGPSSSSAGVFYGTITDGASATTALDVAGLLALGEASTSRAARRSSVGRR